MYINGAILHSFVYLAILLVRIQLLSLAPTVCLAQGLAASSLASLSFHATPVPLNYQLRAYTLINRRQLVAISYLVFWKYEEVA